MKVVRPGENAYVKALIFGPSGHGKTTFMATAQLDKRTSPMLIIDFEGGQQSLSGLDIDMVVVRSWDDYHDVLHELQSGKTPYRSIGLDSISETHIFALLSRLDQEAANRRDPDALEQRDYGLVAVKMRRLLRSFRDLPMHVFFTSLARDSEEPRVGLVKRPALSGQVSEEVTGMMDVAGYLAITLDEETEEERRALLLKGQAKFRVKCRTPWGVTSVPDVIIESEAREFAERGVSVLLDTLGVDRVKKKERSK